MIELQTHLYNFSLFCIISSFMSQELASVFPWDLITYRTIMQNCVRLWCFTHVGGNDLPPVRFGVWIVLCPCFWSSCNHENWGCIHRFLWHQVSVGLGIVSGFIFILWNMRVFWLLSICLEDEAISVRRGHSSSTSLRSAGDEFSLFVLAIH